MVKAICEYVAREEKREAFRQADPDSGRWHGTAFETT